MPAWADAGVPMLVLVWPASWVLLIPIIFVEAEIARSMLVLPYGRAFEVAGLANLASTFLGIPLTWGALVLVEILTGLIAWGSHPLGVATPGEASSSAWWDSVWWNIVALPLTAAWLGDTADFYWRMPSSALFMCIPFYFASVAIEYRVAKYLLPSLLHPQAKAWSWKANGISYVGIAVMLLAFLIWAIFTHSPSK